MKKAEEIFELIKYSFPGVTVELSADVPTEPIISVDPLKVHEICKFLRDNSDCKFDSLMNLSGVDDANGEKIKDQDDSEIIKGGTLSVYYHLHSMSLNHKITLRASAPRENPEVESVDNVWKAADWHEREAYDMCGIKFLNHYDLRRILMPYDWEDGSYPLRKDYKNPEFYNGMKVPY